MCAWCPSAVWWRSSRRAWLGNGRGRSLSCDHPLKKMGFSRIFLESSHHPAIFSVPPRTWGTSMVQLPSGKLTQLWNITIFHGKTHYKWPCSIAMLVYQTVTHIEIFQPDFTGFHRRQAKSLKNQGR